MKTKLRNDGSILLITIFVVAFLSVLVMGMIRMNTEEIQHIRNQIYAVEAQAKIDDSHYLCAYSGLGDDGYAGVLEVSEEILP
ncbi:MAG: hypothetical protein GY774_18480 [Planctomycetes bacterium]|nr:hypothetical protein [Planctomycetota bacterium]